MTIEQRVAVLEEIFSKLQDYYMSDYSGEEIDALLASAGVPIGIIKEYDSVSAMNDDFSSTDVTRGQFVLILPSDTSSEDYGKVYLKGSANWVYVFTLTSLTAIKGPQGPAGKRGAKGADGADGKNFMVLGYYETLSALNAAVPSPGTGDTYGVGTEPPYAFYMYDPTISNWRYVGNLQGPAGSQGEKGDKGDKGDTGATGPQGPEGPVGGASNFVRYDAAQTLTAAQQTQARGNINAAPGGFGYGENRRFTKWDDTDGSQFEAFVDQMVDGTSKVVRLTGVADYPANVVSRNGGFADIQITSDGVVLVLFHGPVNVLEGSIDGVYHASKKRLFNGTWLPWEYDNPPLALGVEYRTTERYLGKPVYCKLVNFGALPNATQKVVKHNIPNVSSVISVYGSAQDQAIVVGAFGMQVTGINADNTNVAIWTSADLSNYSAYVAIKYTKTTD